MLGRKKYFLKIFNFVALIMFHRDDAIVYQSLTVVVLMWRSIIGHPLVFLDDNSFRALLFRIHTSLLHIK